ncbi:MAG: histidine--tRNA ligase [Actinomycetota bacterium]|nr:histidine--tRNA ligase [Actinomycetota bacterium]MDQ2956688.1 histidine--tRNA ligase [Actinomycetota bacterium]
MTEASPHPTAKPTPISGFPELLPAERLAELQIIDQLRATFELHGFAPIETRAAEPLDQLLRKGEIDKEVYVLRRLQAGDETDEAAGSSALGLHFDLTVPFARYVLENAGKLEFPFRRYQIQKVWRGERPQEGRYREFTQADIDVVARDVLPFHHDVEVARVMAEALSALPVPALTLQVNNRKLIEGFCRGVGAADAGSVMRVIDKMDKVPSEVIATMLVSDAGLDEAQAASCLALAEIRASDSSFVDRVRALGVSDPLLDEGLAELAAVIDGCSSLNSERFTVEADLRIARGLDYYTGTVFETRLAGFESLGSICSGGRYDSLASDGKTSYPGVGISFGVTRMLIPLFARKKLTASRSVPSAVLVALPDEESRAECYTIAQQLRARGIACEVAPNPQKYGKQIRFAERRGIPFVWFPAGASELADGPETGDSVRDIRTGEQAVADPASWLPPAEDLRPQIVRPEA